MRPRRRLLTSVLPLLALFAFPALADQPPNNLRPDILYTSKGEFLKVGPMRPLTLNAHVEQFEYDPLGIEAAIVGSETQGDQTVHFVKTIDVRNGHELNHLSITGPAGDGRSGFLLLGWSVSGKYLILQKFTPATQDTETSLGEYLRWDLGANPPALRPIDTETPLPQGAQAVPGGGIPIPSPSRRWIVFRQYFHMPDAEGKPGPQQTTYLLYDPEKDMFRTLALPPGSNTYSWTDRSHLRLRQGSESVRFNVVTGQISPLPAGPDTDAPAASKQYPDLTLDLEHRFLEDGRGSGSHLEACIVWIRRTPTGKPLGAAAAGLTPSRDDPQAVWSPTGRQAAFVSNGDLCVSDLAAATELLPQEKTAVGLTLTCAEERSLAAERLKRIGLALVQYAQDNDEKYPSAAGVEEILYPYLKMRDVFSVGKNHWVYHPTPNLSLASIKSPADTVQGTIDLPCAHIVLFYDGHVKEFLKPDAAP